MARRRSSRNLAIGVTLLTVLAAVAAAVAFVASGGDGGTPERTRATITSVTATDRREHTIEKASGPGYAAWVGAWIASDGSLMASYTAATGPLDRDRAPASVYGAFGFDPEEVEGGRDFWNLDLTVRTVRSTDGGESWQVVREDPFRALAPHAYSQQPTMGLPDGTVVRRVNGDDLRQDPDVPHTAFLQRLEPGTEGWGEPQVLADPAEVTYQITRIRRLSDGRLIATGNAWDVPATTKPADRTDVPSRFALFVSGDDGRSWEPALTIPESVGVLHGNEWDTAELGDGDLLAVMRTATTHDGEPVVKQAVLRQSAGGWTMTEVREAPFAVTGHPELLRTRDGAILYIATDGVRWTQDGRTWKPVDFGADESYVPHYYPRAIETSDGTVHVVSHLGSDDPYGSDTHGILDDAFRLRVARGGGS